MVCDRHRALILGLLLSLGACNDGPLRPLGATCERDSQCESGRCVNGMCVAPTTGDADVYPDVYDGDGGGELYDGPTSARLLVHPQEFGNDAVARFEFISDPPGAAFSCSLDGAPFVPCYSPYEIVTTEGEHTLVINVSWPDGSAEDTTLVYTWRIDLTPPTTTLLATPPVRDNSVEVTFEFEASEAGTLACRLDGDQWLPCVSPHVVSDLRDGLHLFEVRATDQAGNVQAMPASHRWTVDTSTPDTRIDRGPESLVAATSARFEFSSPNGAARFECALDAAPFATCTSPREVSNLQDGEHTFAVRAFNSFGTADPTPAEWTWTIDTVEPISGACGAAAGRSTLAPPATGLCDAGAPSVVVGTGPFTWSCQGSGGGTSIGCASDRSCAASTLAWGPSDGSCTAPVVEAGHGDKLVAIDTGEPATGSQTFECGQGTWIPTGDGSCGTALDGICGAAHGASTTGPPERELCVSGTASAVTGDGPYGWTCRGSDGGANATCSSNRSCNPTVLEWAAGNHVCSSEVEMTPHGESDGAADDELPTTGSQTFACDQGMWMTVGTGSCVTVTDGVCGAAQGRSTLARPETDLCASGVVSSMSGNGPWSWLCVGSGGGLSASCSSNRSCGATDREWTVGDNACRAAIETTEHGERFVAADADGETTGTQAYECDQGTWVAAASAVCVTAMDGACGPAHGGSATVAPASGLCVSGTPTAVGGTGPYTWSCQGENGGASASCSSDRSCANTTLTWSVGTSDCGGSIARTDHGDSATVSDDTLPTTGSQSYACDQGVWVASGAAICVTAVDGACGTAAGGSTSTVPADGLCQSGTASEVDGAGPFTWTCAGSDGGDDASCTSDRSCDGDLLEWTVGNSTCSAALRSVSHGGSSTASDSELPTTGSQAFACKQGSWSPTGEGTCVTALDGACGSADGGSTLAAPSSGLCDSGVSSSVTGSGPYAWSCGGIDGGSTDYCSSDRSCDDAEQTWVVDDITCSASISAVDHGKSRTASDTSGDNTGSRTYDCSQGVWSGFGTGTCVAAVDGLCGSADGGSTTSAPSSNLCAAGSASSVSGDGPYTWSCSGFDGGSTDSCSSNRSCGGATRNWTVGNYTCSASFSGIAHGGSRNVQDSTPPTVGTRTYDCDQGVWSPSGTATCGPVVDGACGSADGGSTLGAPSSNLCAAGTASQVSGSGPYSWSCTGSNGGSTDSCSSNRSCGNATRSWTVSGSTCSASFSSIAHGGSRTANDQTPPTLGSRTYECSQGTWSGTGTPTCVTVVDGACGTAAGGSTLEPPTSGLCSAGTATTASGEGPFFWRCKGANGGSDASCESNRSCGIQTQSWMGGNLTCSADTTITNHGASRTLRDNLGRDRGTHEYGCDQGDWTEVGTGACIHMEITAPKEGEEFWVQQQMTARFIVFDEPQSVKCRMFLNGTTPPAWTDCESSFTRPIVTSPDQHWVFQLRVEDALGSFWILKRTFWNYPG